MCLYIYICIYIYIIWIPSTLCTEIADHVFTWKRCWLSAKLMKWIAWKWKTSKQKSQDFTDQLWIWGVSWCLFRWVLQEWKDQQVLLRRACGTWRALVREVKDDSSFVESLWANIPPECSSLEWREAKMMYSDVFGESDPPVVPIWLAQLSCLHSNSKLPLCTGDITMLALGPSLFYL